MNFDSKMIHFLDFWYRNFPYFKYGPIRIPGTGSFHISHTELGVGRFHETFFSYFDPKFDAFLEPNEIVVHLYPFLFSPVQEKSSVFQIRTSFFEFFVDRVLPLFDQKNALFTKIEQF